MSDGELEEIDYSDVVDLPFDGRESANMKAIQIETNGWVGFTDKYWMMTLIPQPGQTFTSVAKYAAQSDLYQTEARLPVIEVVPGGGAELTTMLFAGAKEWYAIRNYEDNLGIDRFIDSIDWGWFFFLTKPISSCSTGSTQSRQYGLVHHLPDFHHQGGSVPACLQILCLDGPHEGSAARNGEDQGDSGR